MWVAITKLLVKQNNIEEEPEKSTDYLAMHCYKNDQPGQKVTSASNPLIKSTYTNDQTVMLYLNKVIQSDWVSSGKALNLILDQTKRTRDLYYKMEIFSSIDFQAIKVGKKYAHKQVFQVPDMTISGGPPSSPFFYKNPQF